MVSLETHLAKDELFQGYPKPEQAKTMVASVADQFYADVDKPVVIDKNRAWTSKLTYIEGYIGQKAKIICPVRDVEEIFSSFISMVRRNPYQEGNPRINFIDEQLIKNNIPLNDSNRCNFLISPRGILGQSLGSLRECMSGKMRDRVHLVEYKDLVSKPQETMSKIYNFLGEDDFDHDFQNVENVHRERDFQVYGLADMHEVRQEVRSTAPSPDKILSKEILDKCVGVDFWRRAII
jgi:sulfotransferase